MLPDFWNDVRYAARRIAARPAFTLAVVATLAIGIGANVLVSNLIDGVYFRGLPYRDDAALVYVEDSNTKQGADADGGMESIPDYLDRRRDVNALSDSALFLTIDLNLLGLGAPERLRATQSDAVAVLDARRRRRARPHVQRRRSRRRQRSRRRAQRLAVAQPVQRGPRHRRPRPATRAASTYRVVGVHAAGFPVSDARRARCSCRYAFTEADVTDDSTLHGLLAGHRPSRGGRDAGRRQRRNRT